ncbi:Lipase, GDSL [Artemisia annua]|uniref:Lipase, GDSL n=1 Tax=Artemisia annua TaxID=35608 RepID=A0A2U1KWX8_ARTAN|nr:Lipase, GDSL [Artemisia annua]
MKHKTCFVLLCVISSINVAISVESFPVSSRRHNGRDNLKLFVFGDSYVDTGNWPKTYGGSWHEPYGITFPGSPSGRFSDGRVLTDYVAGILGTKSPITYLGWKSGEKKSVRYGMNFAYGGTGSNETLDTNVNQECQDEGDLCRNKNEKSPSMVENIIKDNEVFDIFTHWQKEEEIIDMFVNNKKILTVEELKLWARYMFEWYKEKWEAKWKSECPI